MSAECEYAVEYLYHYIDEELTWARRLRIRWHLRRCEPCLNAFDFEARLKDRIQRSGRDEPPQELFQRIRALIEQEAAEGQDI
jgi:mycothiol system anti-sigma-R factor